MISTKFDKFRRSVLQNPELRKIGSAVRPTQHEYGLLLAALYRDERIVGCMTASQVATPFS
jgi:hypothetical protein